MRPAAKSAAAAAASPPPPACKQAEARARSLARSPGLDGAQPGAADAHQTAEGGRRLRGKRERS